MVERETSNEPKNPKRSGPAKGSIESALYHTGGGAETNPGHDSSLAERRERVARERRALREWAEENGKLKTKRPREDARGGEHIVEIDEARQRVLKATRPEANFGFGIAYGSQTPGATPSEYLDRLAVQNRIFSDRIELEAVVPGGPRNNFHRHISAVHQGPGCRTGRNRRHDVQKGLRANRGRHVLPFR